MFVGYGSVLGPIDTRNLQPVLDYLNANFGPTLYTSLPFGPTPLIWLQTNPTDFVAGFKIRADGAFVVHSDATITGTVTQLQFIGTGHTPDTIYTVGYATPVNVDQVETNPVTIATTFPDEPMSIGSGLHADWLEARNTNDTLSSGAGNDSIFGHGGDDLLQAWDGDDLLDGGQGADRMEGIFGSDTYYVDNPGDLVIEGGEFTDFGGDDQVISTVAFTLPQFVERLTLAGTATAGTGNALGNHLSGNELGNQLMGEAGNDTLDGADGSDELRGGTGDDSLAGGIGNDTLAGDTGVDALAGGAGDDTYVLGYDTVAAPIRWTLTLTGPQGSWIAGGRTDTFTTGSATIGGFFVDNSGDGIPDFLNVRALIPDPFVGYELNVDARPAGHNLSVGPSRADIIDRFEGAGTQIQLDPMLFGSLSGWSGSILITEAEFVGEAPQRFHMELDLNQADVVLDIRPNATAMASDVVTEEAGAGIDTVHSILSYVLPDNVEDLVLTGNLATSGTGNALTNAITGNAAANYLDGGAGNDILSGGAGGDTYLTDGLDQISEAVDGGVDMVFSIASLTLADNVENLALTGSVAINASGNALGNQLTGNEIGNELFGFGGDDTLDGAAGADTLNGGAGDDVYYADNADVVVESAAGGNDGVYAAVSFVLGAEVEQLFLLGSAGLSGTGNAGANLLVGNDGNNNLDGGAGNDTLDGGAGSDTLVGGAGNDVYNFSVDSDTVQESAGGGSDTIVSVVTVAVLPANVESVILTGLDVNAAGNGLNNTLIGSSGNNVLDGGAGIDWLEGGAGDDSYVVTSVRSFASIKPRDALIEGADGGSDTLLSAISVPSLAGFPGMENIQLTGSSNLSAVGDGDANRIAGNAGRNVLMGLGGNDTLVGGSLDTLVGGMGDDTYELTGPSILSELAGEGVDTVITNAASYVLPTTLENLTLTAPGFAIGTGNSGANRISVTSGAGYLSGEAGGDSLIGAGGADTLEGGAGSDLLDGGGGADCLSGGTGNDVFVWDAADALVDGGVGSDTLRVMADGVVLLAGVGGTSLKNIEVIDLGSAANHLSLTAADVLAMSDSTNQLVINGNADDYFTLSAAAFDMSSPGDGYQHIQVGDAIVLLDSDITNITLVLDELLLSGGAIPTGAALVTTSGLTLSGGTPSGNLTLAFDEGMDIATSGATLRVFNNTSLQISAVLTATGTGTDSGFELITV